MNKVFYLSDDDVQSQLAAKCNLLVHIGLESFQYAVIDAVRDQLKVLAEFEIPELNKRRDLIKEIENLPESKKLFKYSFNKIKVSFDTFNYTFLPSELYSREDENLYGKFVKPIQDSILLVNHIRSADIKNVGAIDSEMDAGLRKIFHNPKIFNQASPFVEGIRKIVNQEKKSSLFIDVHGKHIQTGILRNSQLTFYNIFECINADEFNFYLLSIIDQLNIDLEETKIILSGNISESDEIYHRIQKYFTVISFTDSKNLVKYPEIFDAVFPHTYFSLISLDLCE